MLVVEIRQLLPFAPKADLKALQCGACRCGKQKVRIDAARHTLQSDFAVNLQKSRAQIIKHKHAQVFALRIQVISLAMCCQANLWKSKIVIHMQSLAPDVPPKI